MLLIACLPPRYGSCILLDASTENFVFCFENWVYHKSAADKTYQSSHLFLSRPLQQYQLMRYLSVVFLVFSFKGATVESIRLELREAARWKLLLVRLFQAT
jgi:hypothetical protein